MGKVMWKPGTFEYPIPAAMVSLRRYGKIKYFNYSMDRDIKFGSSYGIYICKTN